MYSLNSFTSALAALVAFSCIAPVLSAPSGVCGSGLYKVLLPLSTYPPAESYCTKHYPLATSTSTITGATSSFTVTATATTTVAAQATSTAPAVTATATTSATVYTTATAAAVTATLPVVTVTAPAVPITTTVATVTATSTGPKRIKRTNLPRDPAPSTTKASGVAAVWSSVETQAASFVKTLCSCIETTPIVKQTIHPSVTQTLTSTVSATLTSTTVVTPTTTVTSTVTITSTTTVTPTVTSSPSATVTPTTTISVTATVTTTVRPAATYTQDFHGGSCCYNHYDTFPGIPGNPDEATGIAECQALCDQDSDCNVVALVNYNTFSACAIDSAPYDSSYVQSPCYGYCDVYTRVPIVS